MAVSLRRIGLGVLILLALLILAGAIYLPKAAKESFPVTDGQFNVEGLQDRVEVYRGEHGIPHIFASNEHDLYFVQGYVHAQDRFWQMDFQRHASSGRLSEMLGTATLETDVFLRTMGWQRIAIEELQTLDARTLAALEAYSAGVNAYIEGRSNLELSFEYLFLSLLNGDYEPEPWEPLHTMTWAKAMAWDLRSNMGTEIERAVLLKTLTQEQVDALYPEYPDEAPLIVPDFVDANNRAGLEDFEGAVRASEGQWSEALEVAGERFAQLDALLGTGGGVGIGSNSWAVSGALSETGLPLLANDPHLGVGLPSIWYQNSLHCRPVSADCSLEVSGVSFVGAPGVVIGHNANIAWGFTNAGPDVMDLYLIKVNPENDRQYELNGEWVDMEIVTELIAVDGQEPVALDVRITQFGPIISDSYGPLQEFGEEAGMDVPEDYAVALRWTALDPNHTLAAVIGMNFASDFDEFREATREFAVPAQNLLYADVAGNIGYQLPGNIPVRAAGDGRYPVPGWTDEYAWTGFIPFEEMPFTLNPESGFIVTANNAIVSGDFEYHLADSWAYGYRAQRILDLLAEYGGSFSVEDFRRMQADNMSPLAADLTSYLEDLEVDGEAAEVVAMLSAWDGQQEVDSAEAAIFNVIWKQLLAATFHDELPEDYWPGGGGRWMTLMGQLLEEESNAWWDDIRTEGKHEERDDILLAALEAALEEIGERQGANSENWRWGDLHSLSFEHQVMNSFPLIKRMFNRGPFELPGGTAIVNANSWDADAGEYVVTALPSHRMVIDLSNFQNSLQIHNMGQSGHAYHPNYVDMTPLWGAGENLTMQWDLEAIQANASSLLILEP